MGNELVLGELSAPPLPVSPLGPPPEEGDSAGVSPPLEGEEGSTTCWESPDSIVSQG